MHTWSLGVYTATGVLCVFGPHIPKSRGNLALLYSGANWMSFSFMS